METKKERKELTPLFGCRNRLYIRIQATFFGTLVHYSKMCVYLTSELVGSSLLRGRFVAFALTFRGDYFAGSSSLPACSGLLFPGPHRGLLLPRIFIFIVSFLFRISRVKIILLSSGQLHLVKFAHRIIPSWQFLLSVNICIPMTSNARISFDGNWAGSIAARHTLQEFLNSCIQINLDNGIKKR
jgi:hypothetical protein